jgi:hypothetical protein
MIALKIVGAVSQQSVRSICSGYALQAPLHCAFHYYPAAHQQSNTNQQMYNLMPWFVSSRTTKANKT